MAAGGAWQWEKEEEKKKATRERNEGNMNEWRQKVEGLKRRVYYVMRIKLWLKISVEWIAKGEKRKA